MCGNDRIKNFAAYAQPTILGSRGLACMQGGTFSNLDNSFKLVNGVRGILEYKKKTPNHSLKNFVNTLQFGLLKEISESWNAHLIYALHNEAIDINKPVNEDLTVVAQVLFNEKVLDYYNGLYLAHVLEDLRYRDEDNFYYTIKVKYKDGSERYCKDGKLDHIWVVKKKEFAQKFPSYEKAYNYMHKRFEHFNINEGNTYYIYNKNDELIAKYSYNNRESLSVGREERSKIESSTPLAT